MNALPWQPTLKGFTKAAVRGLIGYWHLSPIRAGHRLITTGFYLLSMPFRARVSEALYRHREEHCHNCPLYNPRLQTCGNPGETYRSVITHRNEPYGCWCYMPLKAKLKVSCWWWLHTQGSEGWPDELNL